jgi:plasmid stabilization system protein ParE
MAADTGKPLEWAPRALEAYLATLSRIAEDDPNASRLIVERVDRAIAAIQSHPGVGTPVLRRGERRFPVPNTGHVINYRVTRGAIRIRLWYRARRNVRR